MGCPPRRERSCPAAGCTGLLRALPHLPALAADMVNASEGTNPRPASEPWQKERYATCACALATVTPSTAASISVRIVT